MRKNSESDYFKTNLIKAACPFNFVIVTKM